MATITRGRAILGQVIISLFSLKSLKDSGVLGLLKIQK